MATYKIKDLPGFGHLLAVGDGDGLSAGLVSIKQFINSGVLIGDRELKFNMPDDAVWIDLAHLELVDDSESEKEFADDNPYGEFKYEGRFTKGDLEVVHAVYENAISITIMEKQRIDTVSEGQIHGHKTLYTTSFFVNRQAALGLVENMLHDDLDPDDLIFELEKLKENDYNG